MADELRPEAELWGAILEDLSLQMTTATFQTWISRTFVEGCSEAEAGAGEAGALEWVIGVENGFALDWLQNRLAGVIGRTVQRRTGRPAILRFVVGVSPEVLGAQERAQAGRVAGAEAEAEDPEDLEPVIEAVREQRITIGPAGALEWTDFYIKLKVAFRKKALRMLKGARLSVFLCLALHADKNGIAKPGGIEAIMVETDYSRGAVCSAIADLVETGLVEKIPQFRGSDHYRILGYAWFGKRDPAPALFEVSKFKK